MWSESEMIDAAAHEFAEVVTSKFYVKLFCLFLAVFNKIIRLVMESTCRRNGMWKIIHPVLLCGPGKF